MQGGRAAGKSERGRVRPRAGWRHPHTGSLHPVVRAEGQDGQQTSSVAGPGVQFRQRQRVPEEAAPWPSACSCIPAGPPRSSRHVPPHRPISARSAPARNSNCGAAGSRGSARAGSGRSRRGVRAMEHRIVGPGPYRATRLVSERSGAWAVHRAGGAWVWRRDAVLLRRPFPGHARRKAG